MAETRPADMKAAGADTPRFLWLYRLSLVSAGLGGFAAFAAAIMVSISVLLRALGLGGIRGDFEAMQLVCAACASLFLPLCQYSKGHVMVDLFTAWMPTRGQRRLDGLWTLLFALAWAILSWRLFHGMQTMLDYGDRTMLLNFPVWMIYLPAVIGTGLSAIIALSTGIDDLRARQPVSQMTEVS
ncbi:TRAP transporter small permease [Martelella alba]|nr:TRAP transporter small permease [Martelella alba]